MKPALLGLTVIAALYATHRLALWAEARGALYYRRRRGSSGALGNAFLEVHSLVEPSRWHVLEQRVEARRGAPDPADPPDAGA